MGKGGKLTQNGTSSLRQYSVEELKEHNKPDDKWIVLNGKIYDITNFSRKHPGGARIISHFAGQDASDAWHAFHNDKEYVSKFLKPILVGEIKDMEETEVEKDFRELRSTVEKMNLFKVNPTFFLLHLAHIIGLEALAFFTLWYFGTGWLPYLTAAVLMTTCQAQAGWSQHDYGHLSVFNSRKMNHIAHHFVIGFLKGASSHWWNFRHFQHHAKPNRISKDPDIDVGYLFLLGNYLPVSWGKKKRGFMPYNFQSNYFHILGPPVLLPIYFHVENIYFVIKRRDWVDLIMTLGFFYKLHFLFTPLLGGWGCIAFYFFVRFIESHWFLYVTQMNHIPMEIAKDENKDWFTSQLLASCNIEPSFFNDWFTGHLNFQIEHHLFPLMPRHNYIKVAPYVKSICKKHNIPYVCKGLVEAAVDIVRSLKKSGDLWHEAYHGHLD